MVKFSIDLSAGQREMLGGADSREAQMIGALVMFTGMLAFALIIVVLDWRGGHRQS